MRIDSSKIRLYMAEKKLTVKILAACSNMDCHNLSRILVRGRCRPATAGKIAEGLCIPVSEIVKGEC